MMERTETVQKVFTVAKNRTDSTALLLPTPARTSSVFMRRRGREALQAQGAGVCTKFSKQTLASGKTQTLKTMALIVI